MGAAFKAPCFSEEAEWRVVGLVNEKIEKGAGLQFRVKDGIARPYRLLQLDHLPIDSIVKGPSLEPDIAKRSLADLLRKHGQENVEIKVSQIPLRA